MGCNLKTKKLLDGGLIGICAVITGKSNTVISLQRHSNSLWYHCGILLNESDEILQNVWRNKTKILCVLFLV